MAGATAPPPPHPDPWYITCYVPTLLKTSVLTSVHCRIDIKKKKKLNSFLPTNTVPTPTQMATNYG